MNFRKALHWLGVDLFHVSHGERSLAGVGGLIGIACCWVISNQFLGPEAAVLMVASMGAGAVLLFAVPHGALSQPWPALGGHLISATIGVSIAKLIAPVGLAAAVAVGLAILAMHYARCLHPPGGASALIAVIGGEQVHALGYSFVWEPVMLNALTLFAVAMLFNNLTPSRRYPAAWASKPEPEEDAESASPTDITQADVRAALEEMDLVEDISEEDMLQMISRAHHHAKQRQPKS